MTYKDRRGASHVQQRTATYEFLRENSQLWLWGGLQLGEADDSVFQTDHCFDAFLASLTSFAHAAGQTIGWEQASKSEPALTEEVVRAEGHILILSQPHGGEVESSESRESAI